MEENLTEKEEMTENEYPSPALYKRWFACIIDIFLVLMVGFGLFSLSNMAVRSVPAYSQMISERNEMQIETGLYDENNKLISYVYEDDEVLTYPEKKNLLNTVIEKFYDNQDYFTDDTYYQEYQQRKKEYKNSSGSLIFVVDPNSSSLYIEGEYDAKDFFDFYCSEISGHLTSYLSLNSQYYSLTQTIFIVFIVQLVVWMFISYLLFFFVMPLILKRGRKTVGMFMFKISLANVQGLNLTMKEYLIRSAFVVFIGFFLDIATCFIPLVVSITMMHLSKAGQDFFDYMSNTYVLDTSKKDIYLDYSEYLSRKGMTKTATLENNDFIITK
ncbi:MAG: RDD family protein [Bacilli bacterium]